MRQVVLVLAWATVAFVATGCRCPCPDRSQGYWPQYVDWIEVSLQANHRIPWGCDNLPLQVDFRCVDSSGVFEAIVVYASTGDPSVDGALASRAIRALGATSSMIEAANDSGMGPVRNLRMVVRVCAMGEHRIHLLDDMANKPYP